MADKDPVNVEVVSTTGLVDTPGADEKKMLKAQAEQLYGKTEFHAPAVPTTLSEAGAPPAQGPNISKEEAEYAANVAANSKVDNVPEEKTPASTEVGKSYIASAFGHGP